MEALSAHHQTEGIGGGLGGAPAVPDGAGSTGPLVLRRYQQDAVDAVYAHFRARPASDSPCVVIPTGGGKTPVIAAIAKDVATLWNGRVLVLAHVKELLEQNAEKIRKMAPDVPVGVYSAGLRRRELRHPVTVAGIQSIWKRAGELGPVDLIMVDEAHMVSDAESGMYRSFLADARLVNPNVRMLGLTATPYRYKSGPICTPDNIFNTICYEVGVRDLIDLGFLAALRSKAGSMEVDTSGLHMRGGDFVQSEVEELMDDVFRVESACQEIIDLTRDRASVLIFACGVQHGQHVVDVLRQKHGVECGFITAETPAPTRAALIDRFKQASLKFLCNVNVLTTGFDAPNVDCIAMLRPTASTGLYYQMVGRGFRLHPGKSDCLVLDFAGNISRHGPVDAVVPEECAVEFGTGPTKECPRCDATVALGVMTCPECGHEFPERARKSHHHTAGTEGILSGQVSREVVKVLGISYHVHRKRGDDSAPPTMRVEYRIGLADVIKEWVCFEHQGYARARAEAWWTRRSRERVPLTVEDAVDWARAGALATTHEIMVERTAGKAFPIIVPHRLGERPAPLESDEGVTDAMLAAALSDPCTETPF
ncbi:MAG: DEAD/DEAH box helicase [Phycisphaeraceae bacterium]|nr:MAG: DEAD/DEAH box helicase [Phycisphaeraceae bacterium]